jgi:hypothetical protein
MVNDHFPNILLDKVGNEVWKSLPKVYVARLIASHLAAGIVYREGISFFALWFAAQRCPALVQPLLAQGANPLRGFGGQLPVDIACGRAVQALRRETRWRELRLFVWAASQPVTDESPASSATLPRCICRSIATYLTRH